MIITFSRWQGVRDAPIGDRKQEKEYRAEKRKHFSISFSPENMSSFNIQRKSNIYTLFFNIILFSINFPNIIAKSSENMRSMLRVAKWRRVNAIEAINIEYTCTTLGGGDDWVALEYVSYFISFIRVMVGEGLFLWQITQSKWKDVHHNFIVLAVSWESNSWFMSDWVWIQQFAFPLLFRGSPFHFESLRFNYS